MDYNNYNNQSESNSLDDGYSNSSSSSKDEIDFRADEDIANNLEQLLPIYSLDDSRQSSFLDLPLDQFCLKFSNEESQQQHSESFDGLEQTSFLNTDFSKFSTKESRAC